MSKKTLFCPAYAMTYEASEYVSDYENKLHPIIKKYADVGHSPFEIATIVRAEFHATMNLIMFTGNKTSEGLAGLPQDTIDFANELELSQPKPIWTEEGAKLHASYSLVNDKGMALSLDCRKVMILSLDKILKDGFDPNEVVALLCDSGDNYLLSLMSMRDAELESSSNDQ
ncbi:hypothetical protein LMH73_008785 [Vibrio splendidus]|nr:hypothetical protein [Vibrio splendidus]MCC4879437.1 hypothetical protein [Vibrio splendidus]